MRTAALALTAVVAFGGTSAATAYARLQGNIESADVEHLLGAERPPEPTPDPDDPNAGTPVNILVMGSDTREGNDSVASDEVAGQRSDTTIVMHVSADRSRVELVSIPRDSLVDIPECERSDGSSSGPQPNTMFNAAFQTGGQNGSVTDAAACTQRTVEQITGVRIHHFVVVDMSGFIDMVDAIGGVPMCIPQDMRSRKAKLDITAGEHVLDGRTALAFARARTGEGLGDGSDTGRIGRQQELLAATARTVLQKNVLTDVPELIRFLNATTRSLTVSSGLANIPDMAGLAYSLRSVPSGNITFMTIPFGAAPGSAARVVWTDEADDIWARMAADEPIVPVDEPAVADPADGGEGTEGAGTEGTEEPTTPTSEPTTTSEPKKAGVDPFSAEDNTGCGSA